MSDDRTSKNPEANRVVSTPWEPFPVEVLPDPVRGYIVETSLAIGCDPSFVALPTLAMLAAAIGNSRRIRLKRSWTEPCVLWTCIVGESGTLKSPAIEAPLRAVRDRQARAINEHKAAFANYESELLRYEAELAEWKSRGRRNGDPQPKAPAEPICERVWCSDTTMEALAALLVHAPRGLLLYREELAGWVDSFDQYRGAKGGDTAHWLSIHGARDLLVDRKTGNPRTIYVPRAAVCIAGGIQPGTLRRVLSREHFEDGLAARLLLAMPKCPPKEWTDLETDPETDDALAEVYERLRGLDLQQDPVTGFLCPKEVPLTPDGKRAWMAFYNEHAREQALLTGDLAAAWSKLEGAAARFALLIQLVGSAAGNGSADSVDENSIAGGVILANWFGHEVRRIYAVLNETDEEHDDRELVEVMERHGGEITARALMRCSRKYRTAGAAEDALARLVKRKWAVPAHHESTPKGGQPTVVYRLTDQARADTTAKNAMTNGVPSAVSAMNHSENEGIGEWTG